MKTAAVLGHPISHSKSPVLHGYWLDKYAVNGVYTAFDVPPDDLAAFLKTPPQTLAGVNLTVPLKELAVPLMDQLSEAAQNIGAVNTVVFSEGSLLGDNTDAYGFMANLIAGAPDLDFSKITAVVLGAGGAARAVCYGLKRAGCEKIILLNRTRSTAEKLAEDLGEPITVEDFDQRHVVLETAGLLVNTTVLGMVGQPPLDIELIALPPSAIVTDIVYTPLITPLLQAAKLRGNPVVDGLGMLLHQAVPAFEAFFGVRPEVTPDLRDHILSAA